LIAHQAVDETLAALAEPTRRAVVELLIQRPHRPGEMARALGVSAQALSRHLRVLRELGVIVDDDIKDDARIRLYRLRAEALAPLTQWLDQVEAFWHAQLEGFKAHAEARTPRTSKSGVRRNR
jgi:DNA-binding transcriptional ArsR family regulator